LTIPNQLWLWFASLFTVVLALTLFLFQGRFQLNALPIPNLVAFCLAAVTVSAVIAAALVTIAAISCKLLSRATRSARVKITLSTLSRAIEHHRAPLVTMGIGDRNGNVVVRLKLGHNDYMLEGEKVQVRNSATSELWGVLETFQVSDDYCVCSVFDRINPDFWADLERRMQSDPSPPRGVTITRELPEESLLERLAMLLKTWKG
jgi:hypothetical protein